MTLNFTLLNLYIFMKTFYQENFDPNFFLSEAPKWKNKGFNFEGKWKETLIQLKNLTTQKKLYSLIDPYASEFWDLVTMLNEIKLKNLNFSFPKKTTNLIEAHDAMVNFLEEHNPKYKSEVSIQAKNKSWSMSEHVLINQGGEEEVFTLIVPLTGKEFQILGKKMGLCVRNQWFWSRLEEQQHNIVVLAKNKELKYCIQFNQQREIVEARKPFNHPIESDVLAQIANLVEKLP